MRRFLSYADLFILCLIALSILSASASPKFTPKIGIAPEADGTAYITVNGRKAIHLRTRNGTLSPLERANIAAGRLSAIVQDVDPKVIWYKKVGPNAQVMIRNQVVVIATPAEAGTRSMNAINLAEMWVQNLRKLLALDPFTVSPTSLLVPLDETRTITVESLLPEQVEAEVSNSLVISVDGKTKPGSLIVTGASAGDAVITVKCGERKIPVQVSVRKYAAKLSPGIAKAVVTGWNAPGSLVTRAAGDAARKAVSLEPGAKARLVNLPRVRSELAPGKFVQLSAEIDATGGDYIPARLTAQVEVENQILPEAPTSWLMYSNDPERMLKYQTLYAAKMSSIGEGVRLLYHHQNMMHKRIGFVIDVVNLSGAPANLHVIEGVAKPMVDTVLVGYRAGLDFLDNQRNGIGRVLEIPSGARRVLVGQPLDHMYTASGLLEFRQLDGEPLLVRVIAKPEEQRLEEDPLETTIPAPGMDISRIALSDHVYPGPVKNLEVTYTAGKPWVFVRIGKEAIKHADQNRQLYGNYGVTYEVKATLDNPSDQSQEVELAFEATAGTASGVFVVDGNTVRVRCLESLRETTISKVIIPAGRSRTVSIRTMPLSGSAYPATLIIRPTGTTSSMTR